MVKSAGQETVTGVGVGTVKVAVQLSEDPQASVATKLMVTAPPQESGGAKAVRSVVSTSHPPLKANWVIQLFQALMISCWEAHRGVVRLAGQDTVTGVGVGTVKVATQLSEEPQASVAKKVMVTEPPQESGGAKAVRSVVSTSQPSAKANWVIQLFQALMMSCWEAHSGVVRSPGQETETGVGVGTVKVAVQLSEDPQASVATKLMVTEPPQESGGAKAVRSVVSTSHPSAKANWLIQLFQAETISCWEAHSGVVRSPGQETDTGVGVGTVKVAVQFWDWPQGSVATKLMVTAPPQESGGVKVERSVVSTSQPPVKAN